MNYPIESSELQDYYRSHIGKEPRQGTSKILDAIADMINEAYIEGVKKGMSEIKCE